MTRSGNDILYALVLAGEGLTGGFALSGRNQGRCGSGFRLGDVV